MCKSPPVHPLLFLPLPLVSSFIWDIPPASFLPHLLPLPCFTLISRSIHLSPSSTLPPSPLSAVLVPNRTDVQCLHRWQKVLNPTLVKGPWTKEVREEKGV